MFYVYVLRSRKDRRLYTGYTRDVAGRVERHNLGRVASTRHRRPFDLIHTEEYDTELEARRRERYLKTWAGRLWLKDWLEERGERSSTG